MIECVSCGYQSKRGNQHWPECRLILLQWIHIEGKGKNLCEFDKLSDEEIFDLATMENEMLSGGAALDADGYFGKCILPAGRVPLNAIRADEVAIGATVRALKGSFAWPGIRTWSEVSIRPTGRR